MMLKSMGGPKEFNVMDTAKIGMNIYYLKYFTMNTSPFYSFM